jgi:16S rRNA G966 N2-methylase RsmD
MKMKEALIKAIEKNPNFNFYQTIDFKGDVIKKGIRIQDRRNYVDLEDIKDKKIVDFGASTGAEGIWAISMGAESVDMIEKETEQCRIISDFIEEIQETEYKDRLFLHSHNLLEGIPEKIKDKKFDTAFCYAILQYIKYRKIWKDLSDVKTIYLETGSDAHMSEEILSDENFIAKKLCIIEETINNTHYKRALYKIVRR